MGERVRVRVQGSQRGRGSGPDRSWADWSPGSRRRPAVARTWTVVDAWSSLGTISSAFSKSGRRDSAPDSGFAAKELRPGLSCSVEGHME